MRGRPFHCRDALVTRGVLRPLARLVPMLNRYVKASKHRSPEV
jgi:hypothetical protein